MDGYGSVGDDFLAVYQLVGFYNVFIVSCLFQFGVCPCSGLAVGNCGDLVVFVCFAVSVTVISVNDITVCSADSGPFQFDGIVSLGYGTGF